MHALSVRQPYAERIALGEKRREFRSWAPRSVVGNPLLIVASRTPGPGYAGEPQGVAICVVRVERISGSPGDYAWHLADPKRVVPVPIKGYAAIWHVPDDAIRIVDAPIIAIESQAKPTRERARPYTFALGNREIPNESEPSPKEARARAAELANQRGRMVSILRDGLCVSFASPGDR